jgi:hypothetical protein
MQGRMTSEDLENWLGERNLSIKKLVGAKRGEDLHQVLFSPDGMTRLVVRQITMESLKAYRLLPDSLKVDISSVSPVFLAGNVSCVFVEYVDRRDSYGEGFTGMELSQTKVDTYSLYLMSLFDVVVVLTFSLKKEDATLYMGEKVEKRTRKNFFSEKQNY